jgi:glycerol uptake facilitator-like aquaporin
LQTITTASLVAAVAAPAAGVSGTSAIVAEAVGTFFLALTVLGVTSNQSISRSFSGLAVGGTVVLAGLTIGNLTGGSVNPARAIAPAVLSGEFANLATYIIGPAIGAAVAGLISNVLFTADASSSSSSSFNNSNNSQQSRRAA